MFQFPGWMRKTSCLGISAEGYRRRHEMQINSKKACWKNNRVFQILVTYCHRCLKHCSFSSGPFLKQLVSYVSADTLQLKFPGMKFFFIQPGNGNIFLEGFKFFCVVLLKGKSYKKINAFL